MLYGSQAIFVLQKRAIKDVSVGVILHFEFCWVVCCVKMCFIVKLLLLSDNVALYWWKIFLNWSSSFWIYPLQKKNFPSHNIIVYAHVIICILK